MNQNFLKKTKIILFSFSLIFLDACHNEVATNTLAQQIKNSSEYNNYIDAAQEVADLVATRKYLPLTDSQSSYLKSNALRMKSEEDILKIYKEAGIVGAEEYLSAEKKGLNAIILIHKNFPELNKLPMSEQNALLRQDKISTRLNLDSMLILRKKNTSQN